MRPINLLWFLVCCPIAGDAQPVIEFTEKTKIPTESFQQAAAYDGKNLYVPGTSTLTYWMYSIDLDEWQKLKLDVAKARRDMPVFEVQCPPQYQTMIALSSPMEIIDLHTLTARTLEIEGASPADMGVAYSKNKLYFFGGRLWFYGERPKRLLLSDAVERCFALNLETFAFEEMAPLPYAMISKGAFVGDMLYVLGGHVKFITMSHILAYSPHANEWRSVGALPINVKVHSVVSHQEQIYVWGSMDEKNHLCIYEPQGNTLKIYNTKLNINGGRIFVHDDKLFLFGGYQYSEYRLINNKLLFINLEDLPETTALSCTPN